MLDSRGGGVGFKTESEEADVEEPSRLGRWGGDRIVLSLEMVVRLVGAPWRSTRNWAEGIPGYGGAGGRRTNGSSMAHWGVF